MPQVALRVLQPLPVRRCYFLRFFLCRYHLRSSRGALADAATAAAFLEGGDQAGRDTDREPAGIGREEGR
jgi:hypothetical protein